MEKFANQARSSSESESENEHEVAQTTELSAFSLFRNGHGGLSMLVAKGTNERHAERLRPPLLFLPPALCLNLSASGRLATDF